MRRFPKALGQSGANVRHERRVKIRVLHVEDTVNLLIFPRKKLRHGTSSVCSLWGTGTSRLEAARVQGHAAFRIPSPPGQVVKQWFSSGDIWQRLETSVIVTTKERCSWQLGGRGQRSHNALDSPCDKNYPTQNVNGATVKKPCPRVRLPGSESQQWLASDLWDRGRGHNFCECPYL